MPDNRRIGSEPAFCPNCGERVPSGATSCRSCGSCEETGWSERAHYENLGIPYDEDDFNYESFLENEFHPEKPRSSKDFRIFAVVAILLTVLLIVGFLVFY